MHLLLCHRCRQFAQQVQTLNQGMKLWRDCDSPQNPLS
jgi:hypothetical protein